MLRQIFAMKTSVLMLLSLALINLVSGCATTSEDTGTPTVIRGSPEEARQELYELHNKTIRNLAY